MSGPATDVSPETRSSSRALDEAALFQKNPLAWFRIFGPGAVIASLTIGAGELIFSSRGGAIFGYRLLWFFALILLFKWTLVYASARHMVLTGAHPFQRWMELPGPPGWLGVVFFLLALPCFPIWVCFHAGTVGTLLAWLSGTQTSLHGAAHLVWGLAILMGVMALIFTGGYARLEKIQIAITLLMVFAVVGSLLFLKPDWVELLKGALVPRWLEYPSWIGLYPEIANRPVWLETITYVGIIGGSGYDYLAYASYIRDKGWGQAGSGLASSAVINGIAANPAHSNRRWLRACLIDSILSFLAVLVFTAVFVACGAIVLGPQHKVPSGTNLLALQAEFVTPIYPWLKWVYFVGAFLAMFGTLYGTIEVAPTIFREMLIAAKSRMNDDELRRSRTWSVLWAGLGGWLVLLGCLIYAFAMAGQNPPGLVAMLTPANLFTGVLACGVVCLLNHWMDVRFLPASLRMIWPLQALNVLAGLTFLILGIKGYWDHSRWASLMILGATLAVGWIATALWHRRQPRVSLSIKT